MNVGDRVRIARDENLYAARGTWPQFRGRSGTVVEINTDRRPGLTEYGVVFRQPPKNGNYRTGAMRAGVTWFKAYELRNLTPVRDADGLRVRVG